MQQAPFSAMPGIPPVALNVAGNPALGMPPAFKMQRLPRSVPPAGPQATLYIRNLKEFRSLKAMKLALSAIFEKYGEIIDIKVKRNIRHRGQAFVSFRTVEAATSAKDDINGFPLFGKPLDIHYAHEPAFAVSEILGTLEDHKRKRSAMIAERKTAAATEPPKKKAMIEEQLPPNSTLFLQDLPSDATEAMLTALFKQFPGFKDIRLVPGRSDIAFVEYDTELQSAIAKQALNGYQFHPDQQEIRVTFAKK